MLSSDVLREQTQTVQALREEVSALREQIELQDYELENMKQRQRNLYLDMDRRINNVEAGSTVHHRRRSFHRRSAEFVDTGESGRELSGQAHFPCSRPGPIFRQTRWSWR